MENEIKRLEKTAYNMYYEFSEKVNHLPSHRILAINRGEAKLAKKPELEITKPDAILVDALTKIDTDGIPYKSIIHGDAISYSIACASIIAKVTRDRIMRQWDEIYPQYGFAKHKGYGTAAHIKAIKEYGPCTLHRASFIKNFI